MVVTDVTAGMALHDWHVLSDSARQQVVLLIIMYIWIFSLSFTRLCEEPNITSENYVIDDRMGNCEIWSLVSTDSKHFTLF